jgi:hypothetical protein
MKQAEDDSAALFRLDGNGAGALAGGSGTNGGAQAGGMSAFVGARADRGGSGGGRHRDDQEETRLKILEGLDPKLVRRAKRNPVLMKQLEQLNRKNWTIEMGKQRGVSAISKGGRKITLNPADPLKSLADQADAALYGDIKLLSELSPDLVAQAKKSPRLMEQLRTMSGEGWHFKIGKPGDEGIQWNNKLITLEPNSTDSLITQAGMVAAGPLVDYPRTADKSRDVTAVLNAKEALRMDGAVALNRYLVYLDEHGTMPNMVDVNGKPVADSAKYEIFVKNLLKGQIDFRTAATLMGEEMGLEPSTENPGKSKSIVLQEMFEKEWDLQKPVKK